MRMRLSAPRSRKATDCPLTDREVSRALRNPNLAVGEVLAQDLFPRRALQRHRLRALLAQPDAVADPGTGEPHHALDLFRGDLHRANALPPERAPHRAHELVAAVALAERLQLD